MFWLIFKQKELENRRLCIFFGKLCHLIFLKALWKENHSDTWLHTPNSMSGKILVLLSLFWHGWACPNYFKMIYKQWINVESTMKSLLSVYLSLLRWVSSTSYLRTVNYFFLIFFLPLHYLGKERLKNQHFVFFCWRKVWNENHCNNSFVVPNSITGKILGRELLPKMLPTSKIAGILKV